MLANSNTFNVKSAITDDWGDSHRVVIDLEALSTANDWQFEISLADGYRIDQIYGAKLTQEGSKNFISGASWNQSLNSGSQIEIVLIINEGNSSNQEIIAPRFLFADSINSNLNSHISNTLNIESTITDDWGSRHRLVLDLEALSTAEDWQFEISLADDYKIEQIYGAELVQRHGKNYISGASWNKSLDQGEQVEIVLIIDEGNSINQPPIIPSFIFLDAINSDFNNNNTEKSMLVNSSIFDIKSTITDDWGSSHRVVLNLEALSTTKDWQFEISQANNYKIDQIYNAELIQQDGKNYISSASWNKSLNPGDKVEVVLIIDEGNSSSQTPITPTFIFADSSNQIAENPAITTNILDIKSTITDDWGSSHRVVLDVAALSVADDWRFEISLADDYKIDQIYGAKLTQEGGKTYILGDTWNQSLNPGDKIEIVLIMDEGNSSNQAPIAPEFWLTDSVISTPSNSNLNTPPNNDLVIPMSNKTVLNVDYDFGGNLDQAIAVAKDGDTVQLGGKTYYTDGITIDKDITITGQLGSVINGTSTSGSIINLTEKATGATIQNLEITNGTTGIYGYSAFNLTLKNLNISNIGLDQTIRDGQHNTGIVLNRANGLQLLDSYIHDIGRKGVGVNDTDGALISGLEVQNVNLNAQHSQSFDAAGIKLFNTNNVTVKNSIFSDHNATNIWNDTTNGTTIEGNIMKNVGEDLLKPNFDSNIQITGIYNEKSSNSIIKNNEANSVGGSLAFNATEFSTQTMTLSNNQFSSFAVNTTDYWVNESVEKLIATTEDPDAANFDLFATEYFAQANIG